MPLFRRSQSSSFQPQSPIANVDSSAIDGTYSSEEQTVLMSLRNDVNAILLVLRSVGLLQSSVALLFSNFGDQNGLFYYLGTNGLSQNWINPITTGVVNASATLAPSGGTLPQLVDRSLNSQWYTNSGIGQLIEFDLGKWRLTVSDYTIRHDSENGYFLRNWKLQGSSDNTNWTDLDNRVNDTTINAVGGWGRFSVATTTAYQYFRIINTGPDSNGTNYIVLSEIEFYGVLST